jgi:hypothetical protein
MEIANLENQLNSQELSAIEPAPPSPGNVHNNSSALNEQQLISFN